MSTNGIKSGEMKILSPTAILGYGFPSESFYRGLEEGPDVIGVDAGSVDPGPYYLGAGKSFTDRAAVKRDLRFMLRAGVSRHIPVIIGTAGGAGAKPHVDWCREIVEEIATEEKLSFTMGLIYADIDPAYLKDAVREGRTSPLEGTGPLDETIVDASCAIVAQMGTGPFIEALKKGCDVIVAGRAYDPAVFAALPIYKGYDAGLSIHLGKILECAAIAADPGSGSDSVLGILREDSFLLKPLSSERRFTSSSTAAHSLYEKSDPYRLLGPGGVLDLTNVTFTEKEGGVVEVKGSRFVPDIEDTENGNDDGNENGKKNTIKIEGVRKAGHRTISIAGIRDPIMIGQIDSIIRTIQDRIGTFCREEGTGGTVFFHLYGKNGVMGPLEPEKTPEPREIGVIIEAVSPDRKDADTLCSFARSTLLHYGYPGRIATAGNLAFPFSPSDIPAGEVYEFSIYHLLELPERSLFPVRVTEVKEGR